MTSGLTAYNDLFTVQIDENWKNMSFREMRGSPVYNEIGDLPIRVDQYVTGASALMACSCYKYYPYLLSTEFDGATWLYRWLLYPLMSGGESAETVKFYIFDTPTNPSFKNLGLEIFNAAGQRVFHDEVRPLKVVSVQTCDASFTGVPGRSYVPLLLRAALYAQNIAPLPLGRYWLEIWALRVNAHTITSDRVTVGRNVVPLYDVGLYAAVDVTGYA